MKLAPTKDNICRFGFSLHQIDIIEISDYDTHIRIG